MENRQETLTFIEIQEAAVRISGAVARTPCPHSIPLSVATGCEIYCKLEYLQRTGSFKERGARNALLQLPAAHRERGVITASAGNHALGVAYHGQLLGIPVTVVMPRLAPLTKVSNCQQFGAEVILEGGNISEARAHATKVLERTGQTYINGYDDWDIMAGQGTLALEIVEQVPDLDALIVPVGGAGLLAGVAVALAHLRPQVAIIAVEAGRCASYAAAVKAGHPVPVAAQPSVADGLAVPCVGENAFAVARGLVKQNLVVGERAICLAILRLLEWEKAVVEGAGAVPLAALLEGLLPELRG